MSSHVISRYMLTLLGGILVLGSSLHGCEQLEIPYEEEPPKIGNFSLPPSQQPGPLFGFGGNIIDKGEVLLQLFADEFIGKHKIAMELISSVLFGITDDLSIYFNFPYAPILRDSQFRSSGIQDCFIQMEYAFYTKKTFSYVGQATVVGNVTFPTGSVTRQPSTGFGSSSFFLGATYAHTWVDWYLFTSCGGILTTKAHNIKIGEQFLYQLGFGRDLPSPEGWIYAWMLEIDGQYNKRNWINGMNDVNSGGNVVYVTPSLWISSRQVVVQFGVSLPIAQNLFGLQNRVDYVLNFNGSWSFY